MKKLTITLDDQTTAWARERATERGLSLSRYVSEVLRGRMRRSREYEHAYRAWRAEAPLKLKGVYLERGTLYDRRTSHRRST